MLNPASPVGVFDSGIGGLSVAAAIRRRLPREDLVYIGDTAHVPYGSHPDTFIRSRAMHLAERLIDMGARAIVIACNTATAAAATELRGRLDLPVVAMEPAVKPAALATRSGVVGVLATAGTLASARFAGLLDRFGDGIRVLTEPCPDLVDFVERGEVAGPAASRAVAVHVRPLIAGGADTVILGCTHFPFLRALVEDEAGPDVTVIDTEDAVARELERRLAEVGGTGAGDGRLTLFTSGDTDQFTEVARRLWPDAPRARPID
jgi:glutamate racemase